MFTYPPLDRNSLLESLNRMATEAKRSDNNLLLALIAACDEALRSDMILTANHLCALIILVRDGSSKDLTEEAVGNLYSHSDSLIGHMMWEVINLQERDAKVADLER